MAGGIWNISNYPAVATQATVSFVPSASQIAQNQVPRLRALLFSLAAGATPGTPLECVVRDGASGTGTIIFSGTLAAPADGSGLIYLSGLDLRPSVGNAITIEFTAAGAATTQESVWAQGDIVGVGYAMGGP